MADDEAVMRDVGMEGFDLGQRGDLVRCARTEGWEAKRPPRGSGSGATKPEVW